MNTGDLLASGNTTGLIYNETKKKLQTGINLVFTVNDHYSEINSQYCGHASSDAHFPPFIWNSIFL